MGGGSQGRRTLDELIDQLHRQLWGEDPEACPRCGSTDFVPILYGLVEPLEGARRDFVLGGCIWREERWCCRACLRRWPAGPPEE